MIDFTNLATLNTFFRQIHHRNQSTWSITNGYTRKLTSLHLVRPHPHFGHIQRRPTRGEAKKARRSSEDSWNKAEREKRLYIKRGRLAFSLITTTCKMTSTRTILGFFVTLSCLAFYVNAIPTFSLSQNEGKDLFFFVNLKMYFSGKWFHVNFLILFGRQYWWSLHTSENSVVGSIFEWVPDTDSGLLIIDISTWLFHHHLVCIINLVNAQIIF